MSPTHAQNVVLMCYFVIRLVCSRLRLRLLSTFTYLCAFVETFSLLSVSQPARKVAYTTPIITLARVFHELSTYKTRMPILLISL